MLRDIGRKLGLEIRLNAPNARDDLRLASFLKLFDVGLVLDVGANRGQFAQGLFGTGYSGRIVSFEALPETHALLTRTAASRKSSWTVAPCVALSDEQGTARFHITATDSASSLFAPRDALVSATPQTRLVREVEVSTARLDDIVRDINLSVDGCFLKMDVQGSESLVMAGAPDTLSVAVGLMAEISLTPLYEGQPSGRDVLEAIHAAGFEVWDIWQGYRNPKTHRLNQIDIICFKPDAVAGA